MSLIQSSDASEPTERQREVLDAVLALLVEEGDAVTMSAVARRASCSKETLYKWFGDRMTLTRADIARDAALATRQFLELFGTAGSRPKIRTL